ncbi:hypothetical protein ACS0TY_011385 [Phlomoides rotata]
MSIVHIHHISFSLCLSTAVRPLPLRPLHRWLAPTAAAARLYLHSSSTAAPPLRLYSRAHFPIVSHGRCTPPVVTAEYRSSSLQYSAARRRCSRTVVISLRPSSAQYRPFSRTVPLLQSLHLLKSRWTRSLSHTILVSDAYTTPNESQKQRQIPHREEGVKEKIILSQEKSIQRLTELVRDLKEKLQHCQSNNETSNGAFSS